MEFVDSTTSLLCDFDSQFQSDVKLSATRARLHNLLKNALSEMVLRNRELFRAVALLRIWRFLTFGSPIYGINDLPLV